MSSILLLFVYLAIGLLIQKFKILPTKTGATLNKVVLNFCLPALTLFYIPKIHWSNAFIYPIAAAWIAFFGAFILFYTLGKKFGWSNKLIGCLIITAGLGNTSFLGYPIIHALYGEQGLKTAILVDQPGTFVVLSTLGILVATLFSKGEQRIDVIFKKIFKFPPFLAFLFSCFLNIWGYDFLPEVQEGLVLIGKTVTPLALIAVGMHLKFDTKSQHWRFLGLGLLYKLILTPALLYVLYVFVFQQKSEIIEISIIESAMAPMITACILSASYGLKPRLSSMMVGFGIPISFVSIAMWYVIVHYL